MLGFQLQFRLMIVNSQSHLIKYPEKRGGGGNSLGGSELIFT